MNENKTNINWYPGHMAKAKKQIQEDLKLVDVVIEILDARIPKSSRNPDIKKITDGKNKILVLNKSDLSDSFENERWNKYFTEQNIISVITNSNTGDGMNEVISKLKKIMQGELVKYEQKGIVNKSIRVMIVGIPNVGKSSFINRLAKKNSAAVGNKPGVTKQKQWIRIEKNIELLDTPGVLWPKLDNESVALNLAYIGTIKDEIIDQFEIAYHFIDFLYNNYKNLLQKRYEISSEELEIIFKQKIDYSEKIVKVIELIGRKRGAIVSGGLVDETKTAQMILNDFRSGKIGKITLEKVNYE